MDSEFIPARRYVAKYPGTVAPTYSVTRTEKRISGEKHVLIVDDDPYFRSLFKIMLKQTGCPLAEIWEAEDSETVFGICNSKKVDVVFCDLNLPIFRSENGLAIIRKLRQVHPQTPIFMVTAENSDAVIEQVCAAGATGHLLKPVSLRTLKRIIESTFARSSDAESASDKQVNDGPRESRLGAIETVETAPFAPVAAERRVPMEKVASFELEKAPFEKTTPSAGAPARVSQGKYGYEFAARHLKRR